jgi:hypothetical protein
MERPLKTSLDMGQLDGENLHGVVRDTPEARWTGIGVEHGSRVLGCNKKTGNFISWLKLLAFSIKLYFRNAGSILGAKTNAGAY